MDRRMIRAQSCRSLGILGLALMLIAWFPATGRSAGMDARGKGPLDGKIFVVETGDAGKGGSDKDTLVFADKEHPLRYFGLGVTEDGTSAVVGPPLDRSFFETSLEMRGPTFSRVFDTPGFGYSERFKHTIGPDVTWTYRTRVDRFPDIPKSPFGDDYQLASYTQIEAYWKTLDRESDRVTLHDMGKTAEGRTQWMAIVTSPENHRRLARYRDISRRLALERRAHEHPHRTSAVVAASLETG